MTKIEWADKTWNPVTGCTKISEGCKNCYAERMSHRLKGRFGYPEDDPFKVTLHPDKLDAPRRWKKPRTVFVCSMGDLFHRDVPFDEIAFVFHEMARSPQHTYLLLTKRPAEMLTFLKRYRYVTGTEKKPPPSNVWLGVTAENQKRADERIPLLLQCPAAVRYVSYEPALGAVDFTRWVPCDTCQNTGKIGYSSDSAEDCPGCIASGRDIDGTFLDWIICGGETGPGARTMDPDWARGVRDQCKNADVPFFFKKMGRGQPTPADLMIRERPTQK